MEIRVLKEEIVSGLQKASGIIPLKTGAAFLRTIWLKSEDNKLKIMSTDSKIEFSGSYSAKVNRDGLVGVQGKNFFELIRKLPPGEIVIFLEEEQKSLFLKQGRRRYKLPTYEASWFQDFDPFPEKKAISWSGEYVKKLIDKITFCIADDDTENMNYMKITPVQENDNIEFCGLNGHQFAMQKLVNENLPPLLGEDGILLAKPYLLELRKWLTNEEIYFNIDEKRLFFANKDKNEIISLPINFDNFPDYTLFLSYFDDETSKMLVDKDELLDSLDRIYVFNTENQRCSFFVFDEKELTIYSQGQETGEASEYLPIEFQGDIEKRAFPTKNIIEILNHFESSNISFEFTKDNGPCKISGQEDEDYIVITMPVEIEEKTYYAVESTETIE